MRVASRTDARGLRRMRVAWDDARGLRRMRVAWDDARGLRRMRDARGLGRCAWLETMSFDGVSIRRRVLRCPMPATDLDSDRRAKTQRRAGAPARALRPCSCRGLRPPTTRRPSSTATTPPSPTSPKAKARPSVRVALLSAPRARRGLAAPGPVGAGPMAGGAEDGHERRRPRPR